MISPSSSALRKVTFSQDALKKAEFDQKNPRPTSLSKRNKKDKKKNSNNSDNDDNQSSRSQTPQQQQKRLSSPTASSSEIQSKAKEIPTNNNSKKEKKKEKDGKKNSGTAPETDSQKWVNAKSKFVAKTDPRTFRQQFEEALTPFDPYESLKQQQPGLNDQMIKSFGKHLMEREQQRQGYKALKRVATPQDIGDLTYQLEHLLDPEGEVPSTLTTGVFPEDRSNYNNNNIDEQGGLPLSPSQSLEGRLTRGFSVPADERDNNNSSSNSAIIKADGFPFVSERVKLRRFYDVYAPQKTDKDIEKALTAWDGQFDEMWQELFNMYGPYPEASTSPSPSRGRVHFQVFSTAPAAAPAAASAASAENSPKRMMMEDRLRAEQMENSDLRNRLQLLEKELSQARNHDSSPWKEWRIHPLSSSSPPNNSNNNSNTSSFQSVLNNSLMMMANNTDNESFATVFGGTNSGSVTPQTTNNTSLNPPPDSTSIMAMSEFLQKTSPDTLFRNNYNSANTDENDDEDVYCMPSKVVRGGSLQNDETSVDCSAAASLSPAPQRQSSVTSLLMKASVSTLSTASGEEEEDDGRNEEISYDELMSYLGNDDGEEDEKNRNPRSNEEEQNYEDDSDDDLNAYFSLSTTTREGTSSASPRRFSQKDDENNDDNQQQQNHPTSVPTPAFAIPDYHEFEREAMEKKDKEGFTDEEKKNKFYFVLDEDESEEINYNLPPKALQTLRREFNLF